ncbi:hypothetical protein C8E05_7080 [Rhodococcus wratislaviensis]|uniref:Uncharacterized protein n=1 Tax=Rhodococcus wratislaviensis TaxID=44752 RepID=A0AB38F6S8_RHOWR|nr:hypothetical protein C8E05_7080 [Rhodococcus wratislaviensis]SPZ35272.1 Uncharacterised protein [Rhodococcus wratislaviensis]
MSAAASGLRSVSVQSGGGVSHLWVDFVEKCRVRIEEPKVNMKMIAEDAARVLILSQVAAFGWPRD